MADLINQEKLKTEINDTLALLNTEFNIDETLCENIVLFVGFTGSGKSTLCQFLASNSELKAVPDGVGFTITDGNDKVSDHTTESKTLFPELVPIPGSNLVLADCPGFKDSRSAQHDIAAAVFNKMLLKKSKKVKIMVVTPHNSVQKGMDRESFTGLLKHVVHFIKDIDKYKNSIGLIVTKVENIVKKDTNGVYQDVTDRKIIDVIGAFLKTVKNEIKESQKNDSAMVSKQTKLIDIFVEQNESNEFSKISLFRKPSTSDALSEDKCLSKNKNDMNSLINEIVSYSGATQNDFGISLSENTWVFLTKLRETIDTNKSKIIDEYIRVFFQQFDFNTDNINYFKTMTSRLIQIVKLLASENVQNTTKLFEDIQTLNPEHMVLQYADLKQQQKYMQFLESISESNNDSNDIEKYKDRFVNFKDHLSTNINLMTSEAEKIIDQAIGVVVSEVIQDKMVKSNSYCIQYVREIKSVFDSWQQFSTNNQNKENLTIGQFICNFKANFTMSQIHTEKLESYQTDIEFFKNIVGSTFTNGHQAIWLQGFIAPLNDMKSVVEWCSFIGDSYKIFVINDAINDHNIDEFRIWDNFKKLRQQYETDEVANTVMESRLTLSKDEQTYLNDLLSSLKSLTTHSYKHTLTSSKLVVTNNTIKLSKVKQDILPQCQSYTELYIFANQTVSIDASLTEPGKNVYIIAPMWIIKQPQTINLRGLDATPKDLLYPSKAGNPGHPGGNFIGFACKLIDADNLTINVSGGNGGDGVDGEQGLQGQNGITRIIPKGEIKNKKSDCLDVLKMQPGCESVVAIDYKEKKKYRLDGTPGGTGSKGGDGGKPGNRGLPGTIEIDSAHKVNKIQSFGHPGAGGKGAKGGLGGANGNNVIAFCVCERQFRFFTAHDFRHQYDIESLEEQGQAGKGDDGVDGIAGVPEEAKTPQSVSPISTVIDEYKQYIQQNDSPFFDSLEFINRNDRDN